MDLHLEGRTALVTGASRGIGFACADALAQAGLDVALNARGKDALEEAAGRLRDHGVEVVPVPGDVSDAEDVDGLLSRTRRELGDPDVLVANAGGPPPGSFDEVDDEDWQDGFELTVMSAVRLSRGVLAAMREEGWGRLIYITSSSTQKPIDNLVLSNSLRRSVVGLCETLAQEAAADGVTANCVAPGSTATERIHDLARDRAERKGVSVEEMERRMQAQIPVGRYAEPSEIGATVAFLASEQAAYITGQTLLVDGGRGDA